MKKLIPFTVSLLLTGCVAGPNFESPKTPPAERYTTEALPSVSVENGAVPEMWWSVFRSPKLDETVNTALAGNRTLQAAQSTLKQAVEQLGVAKAAKNPEVTADAGAGRQKLGAAFLGGFNLPPFSYYSIGASVSYVFGLAGGVRRTIEQQQALAEVQQHELNAAQLSLTGNVVLQAFAIASARAQIRAAEAVLEDDRRNVELVRQAFQEGSVPRLDVLSAESQLAQDETLMPPLRQELSAARHALAVLVGEAPGNWSAPDFELEDFTPPATLPVSLPSELARRRPDILANEAQLHAATAAVGVATANLYPQINLTGSFSQQSISLSSLFDAKNDAFSIAGGITQPLFDFGKRRAQKRAAEAAMQASLANYEQTVLTAFRQVADVLAALEHDSQATEAQQRALDVAESSLALTRESYSAGNTGVLQILDAERQVQRARIGVARARAQKMQDTAQLVVALGGDSPIAPETRVAEGK
ncbi:MAG TPA: efflux transporter outer membrane subunit [Polyangiales bacterium]|nr:efflux transporter outer membrane subunit [Polyangiales bacterium]